ncbi:anthranilate synthase component 1 [Sulfuritortus calidifontis]|uniref:Anthranilate synthase component 1 n=1 Tax=Sulfuritortus calidifontis TaxID=1914471 RepID=A0A4R3JW70_9PROT|nr:aminodeoxychorismate synthase component I [Sulfuritortus calidifontis]TCS70854.1 anthranilate synthase component 1 [Sulfuritortus calidifontis]
MPILKLPGAVDLLALHRRQRERYPALLQTLGRDGWDCLFAFPEQIETGFSLAAGQGFFRRLDSHWQAERQAPEPDTAALPFRGGWFAYLGYELLHDIEPSVEPRELAGALPLYWLARVPAAILIAPDRQTTWLFAEAGRAPLLEAMRQDVAQAGPAPAPDLGVSAALQEEPAEQFLAGVRRIQDYIRAGDVFQVNLSRRWHLPARLDPGALYAALCRANPAPFAGLLDMGDCAIVSSSPERLVSVRDGVAETWPIAGTYPRSLDAAEDARLRQELLAHPKERAEHVMLVDLERNDLGRVCEPGSVQVAELAQVYSYAFVHHIESRVRGRVRAGVGPGQLLAALFPGGTITGCPKVRTMQIIRELEPTPRLAYTGSMGYINHDGSLDFNILIRTLLCSPAGIAFSTGAGIVADSVPERELAETRAKARGLLRALGLV